MDFKAGRITGAYQKDKNGKRFAVGGGNLEILEKVVGEIAASGATKFALFIFENEKREGKEGSDPDYTVHLMPDERSKKEPF